MTKSNPWSEYWRGGNLESCINTNTAFGEEINRIWFKLADSLPPGNRVLDLACGNGVVSKIMFEGRPTLLITGVDSADIRPERLAFIHRGENAPKLMGNISLEKLPFDDKSFECIVSQFGLEYSNLDQSAGEVARVSRNGAKFQFLMHHCDSALIKSNLRKIPEIDELLSRSGLLESLGSYLKGVITFETLETQGRDFLASSLVKTEQISGQVFRGINMIDSLLKGSPDKALEIYNNMCLKMECELARLHQLNNSARSSKQMLNFKELLLSKGVAEVNVNEYRPSAGDEEVLLGWLVAGTR